MAAEGGLAASFNRGQPVWVPPDSSADFATLRGVAAGSDGKIVVVGVIGTEGQSGFTEPVTWVVERFLADGRLDPAFGNGGVVRLQMAPQSAASAVVVQPSDQRILIGGSSGGSSGALGAEFVRLNTDGSLDTSFGGTGTVYLSRSGTSVQSTGSIALDDAGHAYLAGWGLDKSYDHEGIVASVDASGRADGWAPDGILIPDATSAGSGSNSQFSSVAVSGTTVFYAGCSDCSQAAQQALVGAVDSSHGSPVAGFGAGGLFTLAKASFQGLVLGSDGRLKAVGSGLGSGPVAGALIASLNTSGTDPLDKTFGQDGSVIIGGDEWNSPNDGTAITEQGGRLFVTSSALVPTQAPAYTTQPALVAVNASTGAPDIRLGPRGFRLYSIGSEAFAEEIASTSTRVALAGSGYPPANTGTTQGLLAVLDPGSNQPPRTGTLIGAIEIGGGPHTPGKQRKLAGEVSVYTLSGRLIARQHVRAGHDFRFALAPGRYLLNAGFYLYDKWPRGCRPAKALIRVGHASRVTVAVGCEIP